MSFRHAWRLHFSLTFRSIQTSEQLATTVSLYPPPHLTIRCRHRLGTASTSGLQRPCEGQAFMRHFSKLLLRTLSPVTGTSHGQGGITRQGLDLDPQDLVSSPQTAVTDEFPLVALSESSPRQDKAISALGFLGLLALSYDTRFLSSSIWGSSTCARCTRYILATFQASNPRWSAAWMLTFTFESHLSICLNHFTEGRRKDCAQRVHLAHLLSSTPEASVDTSEDGESQ